MATEPDRIREDIQATRAELTRDVDELADRTSPTRVARRGWGTVKEKVNNVTERVMGTPSRAKDKAGDVTQQVSEKVSETAQDVADTVRRVPGAIGERTQGNPVAVGIIAFGVGLLAATLLPETQAERRAGARLREQAGDLVEPMREPLSQSVSELRGDLGDRGRQAMDEVKQTAASAVQETKDAAGHAKQTVGS